MMRRAPVLLLLLASIDVAGGQHLRDTDGMAISDAVDSGLGFLGECSAANAATLPSFPGAPKPPPFYIASDYGLTAMKDPARSDTRMTSASAGLRLSRASGNQGCQYRMYAGGFVSQLGAGAVGTGELGIPVRVLQRLRLFATAGAADNPANTRYTGIGNDLEAGGSLLLNLPLFPGRQDGHRGELRGKMNASVGQSYDNDVRATKDNQWQPHYSVLLLLLQTKSVSPFHFSLAYNRDWRPAYGPNALGVQGSSWIAAFGPFGSSHRMGTLSYNTRRVSGESKQNELAVQVMFPPSGDQP